MLFFFLPLLLKPLFSGRWSFIFWLLCLLLFLQYCIMQQVHASVRKQSQSSHRPWLKHTYAPTHTHAHTHHNALISSLHIEICRLKEKQTALNAYIYQQYEKKIVGQCVPMFVFSFFFSETAHGITWKCSKFSVDSNFNGKLERFHTFSVLPDPT